MSDALFRFSAEWHQPLAADMLPLAVRACAHALRLQALAGRTKTQQGGAPTVIRIRIRSRIPIEIGDVIIATIDAVGGATEHAWFSRWT